MSLAEDKRGAVVPAARQAGRRPGLQALLVWLRRRLPRPGIRVGAGGSLALMLRSPLAHRIILFNLLALVILVVGVLYVNPFRETLRAQKERELVVEAQLVADALSLAAGGAALDRPEDLRRVISALHLPDGIAVSVVDPDGRVILDVEHVAASSMPAASGLARVSTEAPLVERIERLWDTIACLFGGCETVQPEQQPDRLQRAVELARRGQPAVVTERDDLDDFVVAVPVVRDGRATGFVVVARAAPALVDALVRAQRGRVLEIFVIAAAVSVGLGLVLAAAIANPLAALAQAAEVGGERHRRKAPGDMVRIPDMSARPDEIGRLSKALRGMITALHERLEAQEQLAADIGHEIKNPLTSLRSAVESLQVARTEEQRGRLLEVIQQDLVRLTRLVSDISSASRLDAELVREEERPFDMGALVRGLVGMYRPEAKKKGVRITLDLPRAPIIISGLEGRMGQVFSNLISNALSFCGPGDAIRIWVRRKGERLFIAVEDTGPGIPEESLSKIFRRFYSERPAGQFGNHSGLGLAISRQIVEAHGGHIWAENIYPADAEEGVPPMGARFVVALPI